MSPQQREERLKDRRAWLSALEGQRERVTGNIEKVKGQIDDLIKESPNFTTNDNQN